MKWCIVYLAVSIISYLLVIKDENIQQELKDRVSAVIFLNVSSFIFSGKKLVIQTARWAILVATFWNIYSYIAELFQPGIWHTLTTANPTGRPSGFYLDPNKAACVLIIGMIITVSLLPPKFRLPFSLVVFLGVFCTLSRGGMICIAIVIIFMCIKKIIPKQQIGIIFISALILALNLAAVGQYLESEAANLGIINEDIHTRIITFTNPSSSEASDDTSRLDIAVYSWQTFLRNPLFGYGIGYIKSWGDIFPHNMYLSYMIEHGFLGALVVPCLVLAIRKKSIGEIKYLASIIGCFILIWSIFSNTILYDREVLTIYSLIAVMSKKSYVDNQEKHNTYKLS